MKKTEQRSFLFLQGTLSYFFQEFGRKLIAKGHHVLRVNLHGGDQFFWNDPNCCVPYSGKYDDWPQYLEELHKQHKFTDLIIYNDCRYYHKSAIEFFKAKNVKIHVFEEGYFRPYWITYEQNGVNAYSSLPQNREFYDAVEYNENREEKYQAFKGSFLKRFIYTYVYYLYRAFFEAYDFKNYVAHRTDRPEREARRWLKRIACIEFKKMRAFKLQKQIIKTKRPFFLLALQLCSDTQISEHSDFNSMKEVMEEVLENFSKNAPKKYNLVIKTHPEDSGLRKLDKAAKKLIHQFSLNDRVTFIDGGRMPAFLRTMEGMVTINSTAGISALHHNKPVKCLGRAFYNFEGLTNQQDLKGFWNNPTKPDDLLFRKFKQYVMEKTQINGGYNTKESIEITLKNLDDKF